MNTPSRRARLAAVGLIATAVLAACGSDDDSGSSDSTAAPTTAAADTTAAPATTAAAGTDTTSMAGMMMVAVNAVDYAFEDLPETVEAGTMLSLTNNSTAEVHELVAFLLPEDETRPVEELVQLPEEELGALFGTAEPATVIIAPPGEAGFPVVGDGSLTEPGRYAVICSIPIGADPAEFLAAAQEPSERPARGRRRAAALHRRHVRRADRRMIARSARMAGQGRPRKHAHCGRGPKRARASVA